MRSTPGRTVYSPVFKHFEEKSVEQILALAEEVHEAQISRVREHAGKVSLQFAFFLHFSQNICYRPLQKWDSGMEGSLISPYSNTMITQYAPSIA